MMKTIPAEVEIGERIKDELNQSDPLRDAASTGDMMARGAQKAMDAAGYPEGVDPALAAIASQKPSAVADALIADINRNLVAALSQISGNSTEKMAAPRIGQSHFDRLYGRLKTHGMRRRVGAVALASALGLGGGGLAYIASVKAKSGHGEGTTILGPSFALRGDSSVLPGDMGRGVPIVDPLITSIPGVPDFTPFHGLKYEQKIVQEPYKHTVVAQLQNNAVNPLAKDLRLTGREYAIDRDQAKKIITGLRRNKIDMQSLKITGITNDIFEGQVGRDDTIGNGPQAALGRMRALTMEQALKDEAKMQKYALPSATVDVREDVLNKKEVADTDRTAKRLGMSSATFWSQYPNGRLPKTVQDKVEAMSRPGVQVDMEGVRSVKKNVPVASKTTWIGAELVDDDVSGEAVAGYTGLLGMAIGYSLGLASWSVLAKGRARRLARKHVLRQIEDAGGMLPANGPYNTAASGEFVA